MANECTNCEDEIEEGKEIWDDEGNPFCSEDHLERWHSEENGD